MFEITEERANVYLVESDEYRVTLNVNSWSPPTMDWRSQDSPMGGPGEEGELDTDPLSVMQVDSEGEWRKVDAAQHAQAVTDAVDALWDELLDPSCV